MLGKITGIIERKTKHVNKYLLLKGKLQMVEQVIKTKDSSNENKEQNGSSLPLLVYKDAEDDIPMNSEDEEEEDEEIKEIDFTQ